MKVEGVVNRVQQLEPREGDGKGGPLFNVSIEGFSTLSRTPPPEGSYVRGVVTCQWRGKGERPIFWLGAWVEAL